MENKILVNRGWGYSMTLNNFYKIIRETKGRAWVKEIGSQVVENSGYLSGYEIPSENEQNVNFKEHIVCKKTLADGSIEYRGKMGLSRTHVLELVKEGDKFYFNHCD